VIDAQVEVGVTLPVPAPWRQYLSTLRTSVGDLQGAAVPAHATLVPATLVAIRDLGDFARHIVKVAEATEPFRVRLEGAATFRPVSAVVYVPLVEGALACSVLAELLRSGPVPVPLTYEYEPHVTAAHDISEAGLDRAERYLRDFTAEFTATEVLISVRSGTDPAEAWAPAHVVKLGAPSRSHPEMTPCT
jgi:2'-5' RNA ligase